MINQFLVHFGYLRLSAQSKNKWVINMSIKLLSILTYLDLVPSVLIITLGDELSPSGTVVGSRPYLSRHSHQHPVCPDHQCGHQCVLPCPLWSSDPPPATFWSPYYGQTSWSGCRESQDVPNKSSSSGGYCVMQCSLSSSCHHFVMERYLQILVVTGR